MRAFNRFYTNVIGVLRGSHLDSPYSLTEVRVLFELARQEATEVAELRRSLDIDAGYLSRILGRFDTEKLTARQRSATDGRRQVIRLTETGPAAGLPAAPAAAWRPGLGRTQAWRGLCAGVRLG